MTGKELIDANRRREREARAARKKNECRTCGRELLENVEYNDTGVPVEDGVGTRSDWKTSGDFGYRGTGICSLRCGFKYACRAAPPGKTA